MSLEFRIAKTEEELEEIFRLRFKSYVQEKYFEPRAFPDGLERDKYDSIAVHFYAFNSKLGRMVGTIRIIPDSELGLPIEEIFNISLFRKNGRKIAEPSRRVITAAHVKANLGLLQTVCQYARRRGISDFVFSVNPKDIHQHERLGARRFDDIKYYDTVNNWAVPFHLQISEFQPPFDTLIYSENPAIIID